MDRMFDCGDPDSYPDWACEDAGELTEANVHDYLHFQVDDPYSPDRCINLLGSDEQFESFIENDFKCFFRLGTEAEVAWYAIPRENVSDPHSGDPGATGLGGHSQVGFQNSTEQRNWIMAAIAVAEHYLQYEYKGEVYEIIDYLDIWTEYPGTFWGNRMEDLLDFSSFFADAVEEFHDALWSAGGPRIGGPGFTNDTSTRMAFRHDDGVSLEIKTIEKDEALYPVYFLIKELYDRFRAYKDGERQRFSLPDWLGWHTLYSVDPQKVIDAQHAYEDMLKGEGVFENVAWAGDEEWKQAVEGIEWVVDSFSTLKSPDNSTTMIPGILAARLTGMWIAFQKMEKITGAYYYRAGDTIKCFTDDSYTESIGDGMFGWKREGEGDAEPLYREEAYAFRLWSLLLDFGFTEHLELDIVSSSHIPNCLWYIGARKPAETSKLKGRALLLANTSYTEESSGKGSEKLSCIKWWTPFTAGSDWGMKVLMLYEVNGNEDGTASGRSFDPRLYKGDGIPPRIRLRESSVQLAVFLHKPPKAHSSGLSLLRNRDRKQEMLNRISGWTSIRGRLGSPDIHEQEILVTLDQLTTADLTAVEPQEIPMEDIHLAAALTAAMKTDTVI